MKAMKRDLEAERLERLWQDYIRRAPWNKPKKADKAKS